ncbi:hypothetical protein DPX16_1299 [Anabarilius grahami]|uniref:Uncharacterized protein n=1 Tax=Anabarilius grahami TaxID=495550 RepID=A0A3N0Y7M4_ANAGA|nr:hypothetical protein DPX16_1299 [Anabarilius grahami]
MVDALRGRRRLRVSVFKPPCSFWFLLLFGVGGLVLFIHLQDLSDMVLQQSPDLFAKLLSGRNTPVKAQRDKSWLPVMMCTAGNGCDHYCRTSFRRHKDTLQTPAVRNRVVLPK